MKYDMQFLFILVGVGLLSKKLSWKGWFALGVFVFAYVMYNWFRA
jgi:hypothetical protein